MNQDQYDLMTWTLFGCNSLRTSIIADLRAGFEPFSDCVENPFSIEVGAVQVGCSWLLEGSYQCLSAQYVDYSTHVICEHGESYLSVHFPESFEEEVALVERPLHRAEGMLR